MQKKKVHNEICLAAQIVAKRLLSQLQKAPIEQCLIVSLCQPVRNKSHKTITFHQHSCSSLYQNKNVNNFHSQLDESTL